MHRDKNERKRKDNENDDDVGDDGNSGDEMNSDISLAREESLVQWKHETMQ